MFYPVAVDGKMPFVDQKSHREEQIRRVIQKHKAKRHRDSIEQKYHSHPRSHKSQQAKDLSLLNQRDTYFSDLISTSSDLSQLCDSSLQDNKFSKTTIISTIKQWFSATSKKISDSSDALSSSPKRQHYKPKFNKNSRACSNTAPLDIAQSRKNPHDVTNSPPGVSPKRQRTRTVSNIGSVMETIIEELPDEGVVIADSPTDSELDSSKFSSTASSLNELLLDATPSSSPSHSHSSLTDSLDDKSFTGVLLDS